MLFINPFENSFFCFEDFTFRAVPGVRDVFPRCSGRYTLLGISFQGIINVVTFETYASDIFFRLCHDQFISKDSVFSYFFLYSNEYFLKGNRNSRIGLSTRQDTGGGAFRAHSRATRRGSGIFPSRVKSLHSRAASR